MPKSPMLLTEEGTISRKCLMTTNNFKKHTRQKDRNLIRRFYVAVNEVWEIVYAEGAVERYQNKIVMHRQQKKHV